MAGRRRDVDRLLEDMDDVITDWEGSDDAMRWAPHPFEPLLRAVERSIANLATAFQTPEFKAAMAAIAGGEPAATQGCHCFCARHCQSEPRCLGEVPVSEVRVVRFGKVDVPMCGPCAGEESDDG